MTELVRRLLAGGVLYMLYAFAVFCVVVSLISGIADVIYHSRRIETQESWMAEAAEKGEPFDPVDYTPNLVAGLASFALLGVSSVLTVMIFRQRFGTATHAIMICCTLLAGFVLLLPRPAIGTGTENMRTVFAYITILGVFESALFRTYIPIATGSTEGSDF